MHFDDRLATVLRLRAQGTALGRIQYRQLLDLLGTQPSEARGANVEAAYERLAQLSASIPASDRAAMLRDKAMRLRSPRLIATLCSAEPVLAEAAIDAARLEPAEWADLLPALPPAARARLGTRDDLVPLLAEQLGRLGVIRPGLPPAAQAFAEAPVNALAAETAGAQPPVEPDSIGAIVKRIEAYRKARSTEAAGEAPRLPLGEEHVLQVPEDRFGPDRAGRQPFGYGRMARRCQPAVRSADRSVHGPPGPDAALARAGRESGQDAGQRG